MLQPEATGATVHAGATAESIAEQEYFASVIDFGEPVTSADTST
jgi:hypothetical protein